MTTAFTDTIIRAPEPDEATGTATTTASTDSSGPRTHRRSRRVVASGAAVGAAAAVWAVAQGAGVDLTVAMGNGAPTSIELPFVVNAALVSSLAGWATLAIAERFTRRAASFWTLLATTVLLLSFVPVLTVAATTATRTALALMHVAVGAALISGLPDRPSARREEQPGSVRS